MMFLYPALSPMGRRSGGSMGSQLEVLDPLPTITILDNRQLVIQCNRWIDKCQNNCTYTKISNCLCVRTLLTDPRMICKEKGLFFIKIDQSFLRTKNSNPRLVFLSIHYFIIFFKKIKKRNIFSIF